jgi:hypothetical protein
MFPNKKSIYRVNNVSAFVQGSHTAGCVLNLVRTLVGKLLCKSHEATAGISLVP